MDKFTLEAVDGRYLRLTISCNDQITKDDIPPVLEFMDQYVSPVPILVIREGRYSLSVMVQIALFKQARQRIKGIAYVDRDHQDSILTRIAKNTYMKHTKVRSFNNQEDAVSWLAQFGSLPEKAIA